MKSLTSYMTAEIRGARMRRALSAVTLAVAAGTLATACSPTDVLEVKDPDVINPDDVQSAAGANAVRLGAIARLNAATSGGSTSPVNEGLFMLSGLLADEWNNGDSFIARWEVDQRSVTPQNNFMTEVDRLINRARLSAVQAIELLRQFDPNGSRADLAEMYFVRAFVENAIGEHYCNGLVLSTVVDGVEQHGTQITTKSAFDTALVHADSGLALITGSTAADVSVRNALAVIKGRILLNLNRPADAAVAVAGVPTSFRYQMQHSQTTNDNAMWTYNNVARRYSVSNNEGTNGLNFATAKDPRLPVCVGGDAVCVTNGTTQTRRDDNSSAILYVQLIWPVRTSPVTIAGGVEARLIEAEAALKAANVTLFVQKLNQARTESGVSGLVGNLTDPGTETGRVDLLFRERAFSLFSTGHRVGDMRRLVKFYGRGAETVFPTGAWHKGGNYSTDVNFIVPQAEENNPNVTAGQTCTDRAA
jgi:starch-binding outer membrane protein, SusD/RagB family